MILIYSGKCVYYYFIFSIWEQYVHFNSSYKQKN